VEGRLQGEGEHPGAGGKAGDLFVRVRVKSHPVFDRDGFDVTSLLRIPYSTLVLGGDVQLDTVEGSGTLAIPEGTQPGTVFQIRGKGFPHIRSSSRGDHLVTVQAEVKKKLTREQKQALEELKKAGL
jgi:molecular chaperone DnaJ